uniref:Uncharacterized protein n=1 Tax=Mycena chlorophos TaxID=658473 RepID=A0ABQ0LN10_MYCCL|nr:predicted protein [Mycena chlorophos]
MSRDQRSRYILLRYTVEPLFTSALRPSTTSPFELSLALNQTKLFTVSHWEAVRQMSPEGDGFPCPHNPRYNSVHHTLMDNVETQTAAFGNASASGPADPFNIPSDASISQLQSALKQIHEKLDSELQREAELKLTVAHGVMELRQQVQDGERECEQLKNQLGTLAAKDQELQISRQGLLEKSQENERWARRALDSERRLALAHESFRAMSDAMRAAAEACIPDGILSPLQEQAEPPDIAMDLVPNTGASALGSGTTSHISTPNREIGALGEDLRHLGSPARRPRSCIRCRELGKVAEMFDCPGRMKRALCPHVPPAEALGGSQ